MNDEFDPKDLDEEIEDGDVFDDELGTKKPKKVDDDEFEDPDEIAEAEDIEARLTEARNYAVSRKSWEETYRYLESRYPQEYGRKLAVQHLEDKEAQARYLQLIQILKPDTRAQIVEAEVRVLKEVNDAV